MKTKFLFIVLFLVGSILNAQFAGKKFKTPFTAVDGYTYKVGDVLSIGFPTKGEHYQYLLFYKSENALESFSKILDAVSGQNVESTKIYYAPKEIKETEAKILYFKENKEGIFAILDYKNGNHIAVLVNSALSSREIVSKNRDFQEKLLANSTADFSENTTKIKSFSSNFDVKLLSAEGDINNQTVTLTFLISHKLVHQEVCFNGSKDSKLYDFNGNEYNAKLVSVGSATERIWSYACNKIPTNIPVKAVVIFNKILPENKEFSYSEIKVGYKSFDSYDSHSYGNLEVNNINVNWK